MKRLSTKQKGVTLTGLLTVCVILGIAGILAAKIVPSVLEYYAILKDVKATEQDPALHGASIQEIKLAYNRRAGIDNISDLKIDDLDISKDGDQLHIEFAYEKKIRLFANASLVLDFTNIPAQSQ